ncbi:phage tail terminator protein [Bariatricus massiliensis]|uniref:Minor capsid protein n=1 Tax=Bariatricus massiliensis TaxID=1745713 RepID=A0ABS8DHH2_9FIRM|nr:minor capsid protein [Bariatricus massiliensis]MCB7304854.1 minor capsid protein [Bariatricus massiliensis]MCB7375408.1 minor capsid protein [Bariatricus massiliensis]MCB7387868.1 minor capsid protein [Bariatricus massiliensis]MCB7412043.1 minor capsid protein [Bariatricus massiliensis]MDY2662846.1 minor capsid protein [Bariatricus massiliensis]
MTPQFEFFDMLISIIEKECNVQIDVDELKAQGGIYAELGEGFTGTTYYNKQTVKTLPVLFLCRHKSQKQCLEWLSSISNYLQRLKAYPKGDTFSWLDSTIAKEPSKIGRDEDGTYHYSCIINNMIHC